MNIQLSITITMHKRINKFTHGKLNSQVGKYKKSEVYSRKLEATGLRCLV